MKAKDIVLGFITLGLCISLLANMILHYLPDNTYVLAIITIVIVCVLLFIFGREDSKKNILTILWQKFGHRKTLVFIPNTTYEIHQHWHNAELRGEPAMSIHSQWYATNRSNEIVRILRAYLVKPRIEGMICTRSPKSEMFGGYPILPRRTTEVIVDLCIQPPICKEGENFQGRIVFIDQFNNKHRVKVNFEPPIQEEELILSVKSSLKRQDELNNKLLPKSIRKQLKRKGISLSYNVNISISIKNAEWIIKDPQKPHLVYTAKLEDKTLNLYKRFIPPPRQTWAASPTTWTEV